MIRSRAAAIAAAEGLGSVRLIVRNRIGWVRWLVFGGPTVLLVLASIVRPLDGIGPNIASVVVAVLVGWLLLAYAAGDRLVVCDGGLLLGSLALGVHPFRLRWSEIDLRTIRFAQPFDRVLALHGGTPSSARRTAMGVDLGLCLAGPRVAEARLGRMDWGGPADAVTGSLWFFGCGSRARAAITEALLTTLFPHDPGSAVRLRQQLAQTLVLPEQPEALLRAIPGSVGR